MNIEKVAISSITPDPANVRRHPVRNLDAIKGSLRRFGQQKPIVIDANGIILAGNGTYQAMRELGATEILIVRTALTGADAAAFAIADNRTSELAEWDNNALAQTLTALQAESADALAASGFTPEELAALIAADEQPTPPEEFQEVDENIDTQYECPACHFKWSGKAGGQ